jgi:hypothetical protein
MPAYPGTPIQGLQDQFARVTHGIGFWDFSRTHGDTLARDPMTGQVSWSVDAPPGRRGRFRQEVLQQGQTTQQSQQSQPTTMPRQGRGQPRFGIPRRQQPVPKPAQAARQRPAPAYRPQTGDRPVVLGNQFPAVQRESGLVIPGRNWRPTL